MTVPSIDSVDVPESMRNRGIYQFARQAMRENGEGVGRAVGPQQVTWQFPYMDQTEFDWWVARLGGDTTAEVPCVLWDDENTLQSFTSAILYRPTYQSFTSAMYRGVTVVLRYLVPRL